MGWVPLAGELRLSFTPVTLKLAGACCGDLLLQDSNSTRWSLQFNTEMILDAVTAIVNRVSKRVAGASDFVTLSPRSREVAEKEWDVSYIARVESIGNRLGRLFCSRFHVSRSGEWAEYKVVHSPWIVWLLIGSDAADHQQALSVLWSGECKRVMGLALVQRAAHRLQHMFAIRFFLCGFSTQLRRFRR